MRKIVLALLVLLLAVPAMATEIVEVRCAQVSDTNQVIVTYDVNDGNEFRAFGIEISVDNGATLGSVIDVNTDDYYIHPGSIDVNSAGVVEDYGSAIVGLDVNSFILEMGSLYADDDPCHPNAPPSSGWLCKFWVDGDCNVSIDKDAARGGPVMADIEKTFASDYVDLVDCQVLLIPPCFPENDPCYSTWVQHGEPLCWCNPRQCYGDADGIKESQKGMTFDFWVGSLDLTELSIGWKKPDSDPCFSRFICADFDHATHRQKGIVHNFRVGSPDLTILATYWKGPNLGNPEPPTDCNAP